MKRSFQTMTFATLCLAALVSPVAVQAQGNEAFGPDPSVEAGECQAIPPEEWGATFDFEFEDWPTSWGNGSMEGRPYGMGWTT